MVPPSLLRDFTKAVCSFSGAILPTIAWLRGHPSDPGQRTGSAAVGADGWWGDRRCHNAPRNATITPLFGLAHLRTKKAHLERLEAAPTHP